MDPGFCGYQWKWCPSPWGFLREYKVMYTRNEGPGTSQITHRWRMLRLQPLLSILLSLCYHSLDPTCIKWHSAWVEGTQSKVQLSTTYNPTWSRQSFLSLSCTKLLKTESCILITLNPQRFLTWLILPLLEVIPGLQDAQAASSRPPSRADHSKAITLRLIWFYFKNYF